MKSDSVKDGVKAVSEPKIKTGYCKACYIS